MEFSVPKKYQKRYLKDAIRKGTKRNTIDAEVVYNKLRASNFTVDFKETEWFKDNGVLLDVETGDFDCFCYAFNKLNIRSFGSKNYSEFIANKDYFTEIESVNDLAVDQLVAYYSNPHKILHVGLIMETSNKQIMVRSKWGLNAVLIHPVNKVDPVYGDKYNVFNVDAEKCRQDYRLYVDGLVKKIEEKHVFNLSRLEEIYASMPYRG